MFEGLEVLAYIGAETVFGVDGVCGGGEGVPEEVVVVRLRGDVVEGCVGGAPG